MRIYFFINWDDVHAMILLSSFYEQLFLSSRLFLPSMETHKIKLMKLFLNNWIALILIYKSIDFPAWFNYSTLLQNHISFLQLMNLTDDTFWLLITSSKLGIFNRFSMVTFNALKILLLISRVNLLFIYLIQNQWERERERVWEWN